MSDSLVVDFESLVTLSGDKLVTDSRMVAKHFGRQHRTVLRAIRQMECSDGFRQRNFVQTVEYRENPSGGASIPSNAYQMTKDGFVMLAMSFTGKVAAGIKEAYIEAFNGMAEQIKSSQQNLWQQMQALIAKEVESKVRASFGSHLMLQRKREIPAFDERRYQLEHEIQPSLFIQ